MAEYVEIRRFEPSRSEAYAIAANRKDLVYYRLSLVEADYLDARTGLSLDPPFNHLI